MAPPICTSSSPYHEAIVDLSLSSECAYIIVVDLNLRLHVLARLGHHAIQAYTMPEYLEGKHDAEIVNLHP